MPDHRVVQPIGAPLATPCSSAIAPLFRLREPRYFYVNLKLGPPAPNTSLSCRDLNPGKRTASHISGGLFRGFNHFRAKGWISSLSFDRSVKQLQTVQPGEPRVRDASEKSAIGKLA
ncbi:hypothetical protein VTL71DRAFT_464, partial [Oculimacula yallundae]